MRWPTPGCSAATRTTCPGCPGSPATTKPRARAVILGVQLPGVTEDEFSASLTELARLGKTLGLEIIGRITQRRPRLDPGVVVGEGKLVELARWTGGSGKVHVGPPRKRRAEEAADAEREPPAAEDAGSEEGSRAGSTAGRPARTGCTPG